MLLAHALIMNRWLKPVWEDEALWDRLCPNASASQEQESGQFPWGPAPLPAPLQAPSEALSKASGARRGAVHSMSQGGVWTVEGEVGVMALALSHHGNAFDALADVAGKTRSLCLIDWAMPERNLDYLCHALPWALAFFSGGDIRNRFRSFMRYGVEGLVERFHASQPDVFLRYTGHKKYRAGSVIAVWYEVEKLEGFQ